MKAFEAESRPGTKPIHSKGKLLYATYIYAKKNKTNVNKLQTQFGCNVLIFIYGSCDASLSANIRLVFYNLHSDIHFSCIFL